MCPLTMAQPHFYRASLFSTGLWPPECWQLDRKDRIHINNYEIVVLRMARSYWMWMGENRESLSARGVIQTRHCLTVRTPTPGNEQCKTSLTRASGWVPLFWVLWATDLCSWSSSFLAQPCSPAVGSVIMPNYSNSGRQRANNWAFIWALWLLSPHPQYIIVS